MKRFFLFGLAVCVCFAASSCTNPVSVPRDDLDIKWGERTQPAETPFPEPTDFVTLPTNEPAVIMETFTDVTLTLTFAFGKTTGTYSGEMADGLPDGNGTFKYVEDNGYSWTYTGQWSAGHMNGIGTTVWSDGFSESGMYQNDDLNGKGSEAGTALCSMMGNT